MLTAVVVIVKQGQKLQNTIIVSTISNENILRRFSHVAYIT